MKRFTTGLALLAAALAALAAPAAPAATVVPSRSLYSDYKGRAVGDIVTILIVESSSASKSASTQTSSRAASDAGSAGRLDFIDFWNLDVQNDSEGGGTTRRQGNLTARLTANVVEIDPSGLLLVEGVRTVLVNGEEEKIVLRGKLRPQDIRPDNTAYSTYLADASIEFTGEGALNSAARPGIISRVLNWLF